MLFIYYSRNKGKSPLRQKNTSPPKQNTASTKDSPVKTKKKGGRIVIESDDDEDEENVSMETETKTTPVTPKNKVLHISFSSSILK